MTGEPAPLDPPGTRRGSSPGPRPGWYSVAGTAWVALMVGALVRLVAASPPVRLGVSVAIMAAAFGLVLADPARWLRAADVERWVDPPVPPVTARWRLVASVPPVIAALVLAAYGSRRVVLVAIVGVVAVLLAYDAGRALRPIRR